MSDAMVKNLAGMEILLFKQLLLGLELRVLHSHYWFCFVGFLITTLLILSEGMYTHSSTALALQHHGVDSSCIDRRDS